MRRKKGEVVMADRQLPSHKPKGADQPNRINRLLVAQMAKDYGAQTNLIMVSNRGLDSEETSELRGSAKSQGLRIRVVRSRLTVRAFRDLGLKEAEKLFSGPTAIIDAADPVTAAKVAMEFVRKFDKKLVVVGGLVEGKILDAKQIEALSRSKNKKELLADVAGQVLGPGALLAAQLKGPGGRVAGAIKARVEKLEETEKEAAPAEAAPPAAEAPKA
jgi:large subunit ribosomal protein L10